MAWVHHGPPFCRHCLRRLLLTPPDPDFCEHLARAACCSTTKAPIGLRDPDDQTDELNAEQRFERTFAALAPVRRLLDLRYVSAVLDMTGLTRDAVLGKSAYGCSGRRRRSQEAVAAPTPA